MALFKVTRVYDGNTFKVYSWNWNNIYGRLVRDTGYYTPRSNEPYAFLPKQKLERLILHQWVELKNVRSYNNGILFCEVYINGVNLLNYFPEYR
jgi:endonuclease YncB( thermonuclease family)